MLRVVRQQFLKSNVFNFERQMSSTFISKLTRIGSLEQEIEDREVELKRDTSRILKLKDKLEREREDLKRIYPLP